jgi:hypothetical protein
VVFGDVAHQLRKRTRVTQESWPGISRAPSGSTRRVIKAKGTNRARVSAGSALLPTSSGPSRTSPSRTICVSACC